MSDDFEPPPIPLNPGAADADFLRLLKRAIRKIKRDTGAIPTLEQLAGLLNYSVSDVHQLIEKFTTTAEDSALKTSLLQVLEVTTNRELTDKRRRHKPKQPFIPAPRNGLFRAGQTLACKVLLAEPGGYAVIIPKYNLRGFLHIEGRLQIGEEVLAQYVCVHNNRILLSAHPFCLRRTEQSIVRNFWDKESNSFEKPLNRVLHLGKKSLRRASDLFLPPLDKNQQPKRMRIGQKDDLLWLLTDLEGGQRTGCVKASCHAKNSRSALLLYQGRAVGCVYGNNQLNESFDTESSLQLMLNDCTRTDTQITMYALPDDAVLSMSSLFLGYHLERSDNLDARSYVDYIMRWFSERKQIACLAFSFPEAGTILSFVYNGAYVGTFQVDGQEFSREIDFIYEQLDQEPNTRVGASILPPELSAPSVRLGFSLALNMPHDLSDP